MSLSTEPLTKARRLPARFRGGRADLWALATTGAAAIVTIGTWPLFSAVPFAPMFLAVYLSVRWGTRRSGLLATGVGVLLLGLAGVVGADTGVSAMATLRPALGVEGLVDEDGAELQHVDARFSEDADNRAFDGLFDQLGNAPGGIEARQLGAQLADELPVGTHDDELAGTTADPAEEDAFWGAA